MEFVFDDGGRAAAGYKGDANDCVCRSIVIATEKPYQEVYDSLNKMAKAELPPLFTTHGKQRYRKSSARTGVSKIIYRKYLLSLGFKWVSTMQIGQGCRVHLVSDELPIGRLIVRLSKHLTAVINGVIHDTYDPQWATIIRENGVDRIAQRCVYGYFIQENC